MKTVLLLVICLFTQIAYADVQVEYKISKPLALLDFVFALNNYGHHAPILKYLYQNSSNNTVENNNLLKDIDETTSLLNKSYEFDSKTQNRARHVSLENLFYIQSVNANNIDELAKSTIGMIPIENHAKFFSALKKLEPVYDKLIWDKNIKYLQMHKSSLEKLAKKININTLFGQAIHFYGGIWPDGVPFTIALYPVPYLKEFSNNSSSSHSIGAVELHGVFTSDTSMSDSETIHSFGVVFHELCHSIYDTENDIFKKDLEDNFYRSKSVYAKLAYEYLNEALATAVGNAWAYAKASGEKNNSKSWYADNYIDGYAKEIYPLVASYLENNKQIDKAFVDSSIDHFATKFPNAPFDIKILLSKTIILHGGNSFKSSDIRKEFMSTFSIHSYNGGSPIDHKFSIEDAKKHSDSLIIIFNKDIKQQVTHLFDSIDYLKKYKTNISSVKTNTFSTIYEPQKSRAIILINTSESEILKTLIQKISQLPKIESGFKSY